MAVKLSRALVAVWVRQADGHSGAGPGYADVKTQKTEDC